MKTAKWFKDLGVLINRVQSFKTEVVVLKAGDAYTVLRTYRGLRRNEEIEELKGIRGVEWLGNYEPGHILFLCEDLGIKEIPKIKYGVELTRYARGLYKKYLETYTTKQYMKLFSVSKKSGVPIDLVRYWLEDILKAEEEAQKKLEVA